MKKFMNDAGTILQESLAGFVAAHGDIVVLDGAGKFLRRATLKTGKVGLISGGGSGHEPLHGGFVGFGMLDAACPGQVFTSPTPDQMLEAAQTVDTGGGVLFIVKNYEGDVMNFEMAAEMVRDMTGSEVLQLVTNDDIAVEDSLFTTGRRGVAGTLVVEKIVGAAAERGMPLGELKALGEKTNRMTRSLGVALTSCTVPAAGKPTFDIGAGEMEFGVGIHGEPGRRRAPLAKADAITEEICEGIVKDFGDVSGKTALLFVNGFGGTPLLELYLMHNSARKIFESHGVRIARSLTGSYVTSLDMAGCSITLTLMDDDTLALWDAPVHTAALRWGV